MRLQVNDPIAVVHNTPSQLFKGDGLEQIILTIPQINADLAPQHITTIKVERRPPWLHLGRVLFLLLFLLLIFVVIFLALRYRWPGLYS